MGGWNTKNSIVGDIHEGELRYKDLNATTLAINYKFLSRLKDNRGVNGTSLPRFWLMQLFKIPVECTNNFIMIFLPVSLVSWTAN